MKRILPVTGAAVITAILFWGMQSMIGLKSESDPEKARLDYSDFISSTETARIGDSSEDSKASEGNNQAVKPQLEKLPELTSEIPDVSNDELVPTDVTDISIDIETLEVDPTTDVVVEKISPPIPDSAAASARASKESHKGGSTIVHNPMTVKRVNPRYPRRAKKQKITGEVTLKFTITENGTVKHVTIVKATPPGYFEKASIKAIKKWVFQPKLEQGKAISQKATQTIVFKLRS